MSINSAVAEITGGLESVLTPASSFTVGLVGDPVDVELVGNLGGPCFPFSKADLIAGDTGVLLLMSGYEGPVPYDDSLTPGPYTYDLIADPGDADRIIGLTVQKPADAPQPTVVGFFTPRIYLVVTTL